MEDKDLAKIWKNNTQKQTDAIAKDNVDFLAIAKRKSKDIFDKIRTNIIQESIVSVILAIGFPFLFRYHPLFFWIILVTMVVSLGITLKLNVNYLKRMKHLNTLSIEESLKKKIDLLKAYIKRVKFYSYVLSPIGFGIGIWFALKDALITNQKLLFIILISLPVLFLMTWLVQKYIYFMYGKYQNRLKELYKNLVEKN